MDEGLQDSPPQPLTENERRLPELVDSSEPPPVPQEVPQEHLEVLEPLTAGELARCTLEAINDRIDHVRSRHPFEKPGSTTMLQHVLEKLVENPDYAAAVARSTGLTGGPTDERATEGNNALVALRVAASNAVSQYWSHVTEGHSPPTESKQMYLRRLVERIR